MPRDAVVLVVLVGLVVLSIVLDVVAARRSREIDEERRRVEHHRLIARDPEAPVVVTLVDDPPVTATLSEALVAALSKLDDVPREKTADVGTYSYRYADLGDVLGYVRPILAAEGLVVTQPVSGTAGEVAVGTVLLHRSGESFVSPLLVAKVSGTPQAIGSAITYLRRYSLLATLGLATEDDDGVAASKPTPLPGAGQRVRTRTKTASRPKTTREKVTAKAMILFGELGYGERSDRLDLTSSILARKIETWSDVDDDEARRVLDYLDREANGPPEDPDLDPDVYA